MSGEIETYFNKRENKVKILVQRGKRYLQWENLTLT